MKITTRNKGFTLLEVVITLGISFVFLIGVGQILLEMSRTSFITSEKLDINADIRQFTLEMAENARAANHFYIYPSFKSGDRNDSTDRLRDGRSGDFLVLIFQEPWPTKASPERFTKIMGYYRKADSEEADSEGPVMLFEKDYTTAGMANAPSAADTTVEELLNSFSYNGDYRVIVQLSRGLSDGHLFYNYLDRSIIVKAEIIHGNAAKQVTDTYNYTVSPRG